MGDQVVLTARFVVGCCGLFVTSFVLALTLAAVGLALWPGLHATVTESGSMHPAIRRGDVVIFEHVSPAEIALGDVIVFDDEVGGSTVHRVVAVGGDAGLTTRGDANPVADSGRVEAAELHGRGTLLVPWVGLPRLWVADWNAPALAVTLFIVCLAAVTSHWACDRRFDPWAAA